MLLTPEELAVWQTLRHTQAVVAAQLESDLLRAHDLALPSYEVLAKLAESPGGRLRMNSLARQVMLSRSGLTRLIDRLQREGLVLREACESDARGLFAVLTEAGRERLEAATPTYLGAIRAHFLGPLGEEDVQACRRLLAKLGVV